MKEVVINGAKMESKEAAHSYLTRKLDLPQHYGRNLDALWDILSTTSEDIHLSLINSEQLVVNLGDYGRSLIDVLVEAAEANEQLKFEIQKKP